MTEMTTGNPNPPLRMMAPSGAPMKKKMRQLSERVIFLCQSLWCRRMFLSASVICMFLTFQSLVKVLMRSVAVFSVFSFSDRVYALKRLSTLM